MAMRNRDWIDIGAAADVPLRGARVIKTAGGDIAIFKAADGGIFALNDKCPHKGGPLSQGVVHGRAVTCPMHNWIVSLETGQAQGADSGCAHRLAVRVENGRILLAVDAVRSAA